VIRLDREPLTAATLARSCLTRAIPCLRINGDP
jgi:hypothetical protein